MEGLRKSTGTEKIMIWAICNITQLKNIIANIFLKTRDSWILNVSKLINIFFEGKRAKSLVSQMYPRACSEEINDYNTALDHCRCWSCAFYTPHEKYMMACQLTITKPGNLFFISQRDKSTFAILKESIDWLRKLQLSCLYSRVKCEKVSVL